MSQGNEFANGVPTSRAVSVAFIATCPPRQCGIATFTRNLVRAVMAADPGIRPCWVAIDDADSIHPYGPEVRWRIKQGQVDTYRRAAEQLNLSRVNLVNLQHEFGLYGIWGDPFEDHLVPFLETLRKPLVTTLHTVLPAPSPSVREAIWRLCVHSRVVIVMTNIARQLLISQYGLDPPKVVVIPHGMPPIEPRDRTRIKQRFGLMGRTLISTFGLVDPRKGLEYMIGAMECVREQHPDALYLIIGKTHPVLVRRVGEAYRNQLVEMVNARGLSQHVAFMDAYLTQQQIVDYLLATDVYVTPYLDPNQITSGTLAYALGAGKAVVSTPYLHASEALADGRGVLVDFRSEEQLATAVNRILDNPRLQQQLELRARAYGCNRDWPTVGRRMARLLRDVAQPLQSEVETQQLVGLARHDRANLAIWHSTPALSADAGTSEDQPPLLASGRAQ